MTNQGNGSHFFTLCQRHWVTTKEIAPPVQVGEMDEVALVMVEIGVRAFSIFMGLGLGLVFGRVIGLKG